MKASAFLGVKGSRVQISPARPKQFTPSDLVGPVFQPAFLPPSIGAEQRPLRTSYGPPGRKRPPSVQHGLHIGMQVASRDRRILMSGDPLQDVQIDASVGHPCQGGVPWAVADQARAARVQ